VANPLPPSTTDQQTQEEAGNPQIIPNLVKMRNPLPWPGIVDAHGNTTQRDSRPKQLEQNLELKLEAPPIENEANNGLKNVRYSLAMARTSDPHSASAQFFINTTKNDFLDFPGQDGWGYCVFGEVIEGQEVINKISSSKTTRSGMYSDVPVENIVIEKAEIV
jgi:cyclophilin family peptidyl-prolyl cis-trans isomerase